jgi:hypothetical protein
MIYAASLMGRDRYNNIRHTAVLIRADTYEEAVGKAHLSCEKLYASYPMRSVVVNRETDPIEPADIRFVD